tara:strand:- start:70 stop:594 length:525 start_codon:yes stop_codon:yes gene_type:complete
MSFIQENDFIVILGSLNATLGGSSYLKTIHNRIEGPLFHFNPEDEKNVQDACLESIRSNIVNSAHDISDGGLAVALSEMVVNSKNNLGAKIVHETKISDIEFLFGECASAIVVAINQSKLLDLELIAKKYDVTTQAIGVVTNDGKLTVNSLIDIDKKQLSNKYFNSLSNVMENK